MMPGSHTNFTCIYKVWQAELSGNISSQGRNVPAKSFKQGGPVVEGCCIARLYLQGPGVVCHSIIIAPQAVIGECTVVESSTVPRIQLDSSTVILQSLLKTALQDTSLHPAEGFCASLLAMAQ